MRLLNEKDIFNENSLIVMACMKDNGGGATCAQLAAKYGRHFGFYNMTSSKLAKRVAKKLNVRFRMIIMQNIGLFFILADILKKAN
ncbi:MAG: hypothetical protein IJP69_00845 [Synergistaceae bacterium]|nr:hypothetical protein [Synergistaceae bacterium]MBR0078898.1 hypothetical protein [Synergistaceae bacterium]